MIDGTNGFFSGIRNLMPEHTHGNPVFLAKMQKMLENYADSREINRKIAEKRSNDKNFNKMLISYACLCAALFGMLVFEIPVLIIFSIIGLVQEKKIESSYVEGKIWLKKVAKYGNLFFLIINIIRLLIDIL